MSCAKDIQEGGRPLNSRAYSVTLQCVVFTVGDETRFSFYWDGIRVSFHKMPNEWKTFAGFKKAYSYGWRFSVDPVTGDMCSHPIPPVEAFEAAYRAAMDQREESDAAAAERHNKRCLDNDVCPFCGAADSAHKEKCPWQNDIDVAVEKSGGLDADQFNDGFQAYKDGKPIDSEPQYDTSEDTWRIGWVWAKHCDEESQKGHHDAD